MTQAHIVAPTSAAAPARPHPATRRQACAALLLVVVAVGGLWSVTRLPPSNLFDQPFYLGIAYDLRHAGTYTDGFVFADPAQGEVRPPGMRLAPLYPALLAAAAAFDSGFRRTMDCVVATDGKDEACPRRASLVRGAQLTMLVVFFLGIWWLAGAVYGSAETAWLALLIALITAPLLLRYVNYTMTEITSVALFTGSVTALVVAVTGRAPGRWLAVAGVCFGLAALTRPAFLYGGIAVAAACFALAGRSRGWRGVGSRVAFLLGFVAMVTPWMLRNALVVGHLGLTRGYDSHTLVQRISFDQMSWREYGLSYLCWLPEGSRFGHWLAGAGACDRFGWEERPDTFYAIGAGTFMRDTVTAAGGWDQHLSYLLRTYILHDPLKHALVTIPLALRGAWIDHVWGLVLMPICLVATVCAWRRRNLALLAVALPAWFMLLFNAAVAVNQVRYNLVLIPAYSLAGAAAVRWLVDRARRRTIERRPFANASLQPAPQLASRERAPQESP